MAGIVPMLRGVAPMGLVRKERRNNVPMSRDTSRAQPGTAMRPRYKSMNREQWRSIWGASMVPQVGAVPASSRSRAARSSAIEGVSGETSGREINRGTSCTSCRTHKDRGRSARPSSQSESAAQVEGAALVGVDGPERWRQDDRACDQACRLGPRRRALRRLAPPCWRPPPFVPGRVVRRKVGALDVGAGRPCRSGWCTSSGTTRLGR